ncbi:peptidoglycan-binding domain-containing protein [Kitasatospora sp. NPDC002551]|uniref:peptidoglycan-binding domain-containing protein n=1 Tax=Kitasatospora sp. NPDC002551 TaxID=3154539 RepID=UPI0033306D30
MPDQHCPTCGSARSAGCGCLVPDGSLDETTVLPHMEGPPLVRPYVPQAVGQVVDGPPDGVAGDPFGTTVLPPAGPPDAPAAVPPLGPDADAYATTVLPPVASAPPFPPQQPQQPQPDGVPAPDADELGVFPVAPAAPGGGRAARRAAEQEGARGPLARRKGLLIAAGAGLLAVTVGLAYAITPSSEPNDRAAPAPTATLGLAPVDPSTPAQPSPSAPQPAESTESAPTPTPTRTTAKASPTRSATGTPPPAAPATTEAAAPPVKAPEPDQPATAPPAPPAPLPTTPPPAPTTAPPTPAPTAAPKPTPTPTVRVLEYGMEGPDVQALQRQLSVVICWEKVPPTGKYDDRTRLIVTYFQDINGIRGDARGVYGPVTRAALEGRTGC